MIRRTESNWVSTVKSIKHWKDMVERMKWLMESGFTYVTPHSFRLYMFHGGLFLVLDTNWLSDSCALCCRLGCRKCPLDMIDLGCNEKNSPWRLTLNAFSLAEFIENAERYMIPALYQAKRWCEEQGEV